MYPDTTTTVDARQAACFERLRGTLLADKYKDRLPKQLGYWALPNDRRLPQALLGHALEDVLAKPFPEIAATRGVGPKKIESLFVLLSRAAAQQPPGADLLATRNVNGLSHERPRTSFTLAEAPDVNIADAEDDEASWARSGAVAAGDLSLRSTDFDPGIVSEALWQVWQQDVIELGVGDLTIGQVVETLDGVPTVLWQTPLERYVDRSLAEIRTMRTHGAKRVSIILQAFWTVHRMRLKDDSPEIVRRALTPAFVAPLEKWVARCLESDIAPVASEIITNFTAPLLTQIEHDCGESVSRLAHERLGTAGKPHSVRSQARRLGVTRARIYQLFEQCGKAIEVRWPAGRELTRRLEVELAARTRDAERLRIFNAAVELCYPRRFELEV